MLRRKMLDYLHEWKQSHGAQCLLVNGARQVGKSYIIKKFGESYENFIVIDFVEHPEYAAIFEGSLAAEDIYSRITLFIPGARSLLTEKAESFEAYALKDGETAAFTMSLGDLTDDEREILADGCLINYYKTH